MADFVNIPLGYNTTTQIPLYVKTYSTSEAQLQDLGLDDNLAYTYEDGLVVRCVQEGTRYKWLEVPVCLENTGLLNNDFIYPPDFITFGIDYSNKRYNFFSADQNNFVRQLFIDKNNLPNEYELQDICDYILLLPEIDRTIVEVDSKWNVIIMTPGEGGPSIEEIYEIQNIGKGVIETIEPENLLRLLYKEIQTFEDVLNKDSELHNSHYVIIDEDQEFIIKNDGSGGYLNIFPTSVDPESADAVIGRGVGNDLTDVSLKFNTNKTIFRDKVNNRGIEYDGDYETNFLPRTLITLQKAQSLISAISPADGSETKVISGTGISITGSGTTGSPYIVTNTHDGSETKITNGTNTTVSGSGTTGSPYQVNVATPSAGIQVVILTLSTWSINWGTVVYTGLPGGETLLNVSIFAEAKVANNNYSIGDITSVSTIDVNDAGGLADGGVGIKFKANTPDHIWVGINDRIAVNESVIAANTIIGNPITITDVEWSLRFVVTYIT